MKWKLGRGGKRRVQKKRETGRGKDRVCGAGKIQDFTCRLEPAAKTCYPCIAHSAFRRITERKNSVSVERQRREEDTTDIDEALPNFVSPFLDFVQTSQRAATQKLIHHPSLPPALFFVFSYVHIRYQRLTPTPTNTTYLL